MSNAIVKISFSIQTIILFSSKLFKTLSFTKNSKSNFNFESKSIIYEIQTNSNVIINNSICFFMTFSIEIFHMSVLINENSTSNKKLIIT